MFSVEYVLRLSVAKPMRSSAFSFFGLVDLAAILRFYIALGLELQSLRGAAASALPRRPQVGSLRCCDGSASIERSFLCTAGTRFF